MSDILLESQKDIKEPEGENPFFPFAGQLPDVPACATMRRNCLTSPPQGAPIDGAVRHAKLPREHEFLAADWEVHDPVKILNVRVDADHRDPLAARGFRPFRVTHRWREDGREREHARDITALPMTYTIETAGEPEMISVASEMPGSR
jgi:hypothetical protein